MASNSDLKKQWITVSINENLVKWLDAQVEKRIEWKDRSQAV